MIESMTNKEFQDKVNMGDSLCFSAHHKRWAEFLGYEECDSINTLCKGCKGYIKYVFPEDMVNSGCFRHGECREAVIEVEIKNVWLNEEDFLL